MSRIAAALLLALASPAAAQDHSGHAMPAPDPHAGHVMPAPAGPATPGNAAAPPVPRDHHADRDFPAADMARARAAMMAEDGGQTFSLVMLNIAEAQVRDGGNGYRWDAEAWFGGDIDRVTIKSEGEGGGRLDEGEVQALYSRAIGPYFNLQAGVRQDIRPSPARTYATIGIEGLAPYWFEVEAAAFLSDRGRLSARLEVYYDQRLTQRLVLQPRAELNVAATDGRGGRDTTAEFDLRLRYEISRRFAPYIGVSRAVGAARAAGDTAAASFVSGVRMWF